MKKLIFALMSLMPMFAWAQWETPDNQENTQQKTKWTKPEAEKTTTEKKEKTYEWAAYLGDVVPTDAEGNVVWERTFNNQLSAEENYNHMLEFMNNYIKGKNFNPESRVALVNKAERSIAAHIDEYITFSSTFISLDRSRLIYTLQATCDDHRVTVKAFRISYGYEENRKGGYRYHAETWITDKYAVNKKHTRLLPLSGKFRRKTVDRMEELMQQFEYEVIKQ